METAPAATANEDVTQLHPSQRNIAPSTQRLTFTNMPFGTQVGTTSTTAPGVEHERIVLGGPAQRQADNHLLQTTYNMQMAPQQQVRLGLRARFGLVGKSPQSADITKVQIWSETDFPVLARAVDSVASLRTLQLKYFWFTYGYHGVNINDVAGYELYIPDPRQSSGFAPLGFCMSDARWQKQLASVTELYRHNCPTHEPCRLCTNLPLLFIYFRGNSWGRVPAARNQINNLPTMTFLDGYSEEYANHLRNGTQTAREQYLRICQKVFRDLQPRGLSALRVFTPLAVGHSQSTVSTFNTPIIQQSTTNPVPLGSAPLAPTTLGRRARVQSSSPTNLTDQATPSGAPQAKRSRRLEMPQDAKPPRTKDTNTDYSQVVAQPTGDTKSETDKCFTCVNLGRSCNGTKMVDGRCEMCAKKYKSGGSRKCYWRKPGIDTYEQAKAADKTAVYNDKNTRAGRARRALERQTAGRGTTQSTTSSAEATDHPTINDDKAELSDNDDNSITNTTNTHSGEPEDENSSPIRPEDSTTTEPQDHHGNEEEDDDHSTVDTAASYLVPK